MTAALPGPGALLLLAGAASHVAHGLPTSPALAPQAGGPGAASQHLATTVSAGHLLLQLVVGLGVVVGLVMLASRLLRGRGAGGLVAHGGGRRSPLKVLGRHTLGKGVSVAVVQFGDEAYLVGVTPQSVRRLAVTDAARLMDEEGVPARRSVVARLTGPGVPDRAATGPGDRALARAVGRRWPGLAALLSRLPAAPGADGGTELVSSRDAGSAVLDLVPATRSGRATPIVIAGNGHARPVTRRGGRPAPTWTSAIEHLRERTVRRA